MRVVFAKTTRIAASFLLKIFGMTHLSCGKDESESAHHHVCHKLFGAGHNRLVLKQDTHVIEFQQI